MLHITNYVTNLITTSRIANRYNCYSTGKTTVHPVLAHLEAVKVTTNRNNTVKHNPTDNHTAAKAKAVTREAMERAPEASTTVTVTRNRIRLVRADTAVPGMPTANPGTERREAAPPTVTDSRAIAAGPVTKARLAVSTEVVTPRRADTVSSSDLDGLF